MELPNAKLFYYLLRRFNCVLMNINLEFSVLSLVEKIKFQMDVQCIVHNELLGFAEHAKQRKSAPSLFKQME